MDDNILVINTIRRICNIIEDNVRGNVSFIFEKEDEAYRIVIDTQYFDWTEFIEIEDLENASFDDEKRIVDYILTEFRKDIINEFFKIYQ